VALREVELQLLGEAVEQRPAELLVERDVDRGARCVGRGTPGRSPRAAAAVRSVRSVRAVRASIAWRTWQVGSWGAPGRHGGESLASSRQAMCRGAGPGLRGLPCLFCDTRVSAA
jgi:hypothetical protein